MATPKKVPVNPRDLCAGMMKLITAGFQPGSVEPPQLMLCKGLSVEVKKLWRNLGRKQVYAGNIEVAVPTVAEMAKEARNSIAPERNRAWEQLARVLSEQPASAGSPPPERLRVTDLVRVLHSAPPDEHARVMELLHRVQAADALFSGLCYMALVNQLERYDKLIHLLPQMMPELGLAGKTDLEKLEAGIELLPADQATRLNKLIHGYRGFSPFLTFCRMFFDTTHWDVETLPSEAVLDLFPSQLNTQDDSLPMTLDLKDKHIERDSGRVDTQLFDFYTQLPDCEVKVVEADGWFKQDERDFVAFLITAPSGRRVAVLEPVGGRAFAHLFIMRDAFAGWGAAAIKEKYRLFGDEAPIMRRFLHPIGWQQRVQDFIATLG